MNTDRMTAILNSVSQRVEKLVPSGRFYVVLYDQNKNELRFHAVRGKKGLSTGDARPCRSDSTLPDLVIVKAKSLLYESDLSSRVVNGETCYWPNEKDIPHSWLGVPLVVADRVFGALVVENWQRTYSFNKDHEATLATVARQASIAIENIRLYEQLDIANKQLKRRGDNLKVLNDVGQQLSRGLVKQEDEILSLAIQSVTKLQLDTHNMYIAFYEPDPNKLDTADDVYGKIRIGATRNIEQKVPMRNRNAQRGLTEYVIRTKKSFKPIDVQRAYEEYAPDSIQSSQSPRARSWLGVPILLANQALGAIVLRNYEFEEVYTDDDRDVIEVLAGLVSAGLDNLRRSRIEERMQEERNAAENMAIMSMTAAEFAHKMNNLAGTIPVRIDMAKSLLDGNDPKNAKIIEYLEKIRNEADGILSAAKEIRESTEAKAPEDVDVNQLLEIAIKRAENSQKNIQNSIEVMTEFTKDVPSIKVERNSFLDTLTSIIKNGFESIEIQGTLTVKTYCLRRVEKTIIEIEVSDTGKGIPPSDLPKIFDLFYTTKGGKGLGFGLWRDRTFIKRLGGEIDVQSELGKGSTFTIRIPCGVEK